MGRPDKSGVMGLDLGNFQEVTSSSPATVYGRPGVGRCRGVLEWIPLAFSELERQVGFWKRLLGLCMQD